MGVDVRILDRHIANSVGYSMFLVLLGLLSLDVIFAFIDELKDIENDYGLPQVLAFILYTIPRRIFEIMHFVVFIGALVGLGALASSSELVVMRAAGVSTSRIVWAVVKPALVFIIVGMALAEYIAPATEQIANSRRTIQQEGFESLTAPEGVWHREDSTYMHIKFVMPGGELHQLTRYKFDDTDRLIQTSFAEYAEYQSPDSDTHYWLLSNVNVTDFIGDEILVTHNERMRWDTDVTPTLINIRSTDPDRLSIREMYYQANYLNGQGVEAGAYWLGYWNRLLTPLTTLSLVLVAISFVFGPLRSVTMSFRIFSGMLVGVAVQYLQSGLGHASLAFNFDPFIGAIVPSIACLIIGSVLLRRQG